MKKRVEFDDDVFLPCYQHLSDSDADVNLLWGGRDSGKSVFVAQKLLLDCLEQSNFRCILIRKTFESIKDSQWQLLKDIAEEWKIDDQFHFKVSPLEITCISNGNKFIARGCDKPGKLKSITNPTHVWFEEFNQLAESDYITISTTLRSNERRVQEWATFNPEAEGDYDEFWLFKTFLKSNYDKGVYSFTETRTIDLPGGGEASLKYTSTHTTYQDNEYCSVERIARHENLSTTNPYYYLVFTKGKWGNPEAQSPFCTQYNPAKHESNIAILRRELQLIISIDFNINPFAISFYHSWTDSKGVHLYAVAEKDIPNGSIPAMIKYIDDHYRYWLPACIMTGDSTGNNRRIDQIDLASLFTQLQRGLRLHPKQIQTPNNPTHFSSRNDCNYFLLHFPDFKINPETCPKLIRDLKFVQWDEKKSQIIKSDRSDEKQRADFLDTFRAVVNTFYKSWINIHSKRAA